MKLLVSIAAVLSLMVLTQSCETMSADDCASADWNLKGQEDGQEGYSLTRLNRHSKACMKHGAIVDKAAYTAGRKTGLNRYCTADHQYSQAKDGRGKLTVCNELGSSVMSKLDQAYRAGSRVASLRDELSNVVTQIDDMEKEKEVATRMSTRRELSSSLSRLNRQRYDLDNDISAAERDGEQIIRSLRR